MIEYVEILQRRVVTDQASTERNEDNSVDAVDLSAVVHDDLLYVVWQLIIGDLQLAYINH